MKTTSRITVISTICVVVFAGCAGDNGQEGAASGTTAAETAGAEIRDVIETQADAWNEGSIGGFMAGYAQTDTLRFASGGNVWRGWTQTLQRYRESYPDEGTMGRLAFTDLEIWPLSDDYAVAFGRWDLTRSERYENIGGLFTLIFERGPEGWRIVHDHTSARESIESPGDTASPGGPTPPAGTGSPEEAASPQSDTLDVQ